MAVGRQEEWFLLLAVLFVVLGQDATGAPDNTTTQSYPPDPRSTPAYSSPSSSTQDTSTAGQQYNTSWAGPGEAGSSPQPSPTRRPLCAVDGWAREARCDAAVLQGLPPHVDLPDNLTRLVVTARGVPHMGRTLLTRALNNNNFTSLHSLERLTINNFGLSQLQNSTFAALPYLEFLDLSNNQIHNLHDVTFVGLNKLETLNLSFNQIAVIRADFFNLPSLKHLVLSYNRFSTLPNGAFKLLSVLQTLTLEGNDLGSLTSGNAFLGLDHLRELGLSRCNLDVPHSLFDHTQSVDTLYLAHNNIHSIPSEAIKQLYFLQTLVLSNNKIRSLQNEAFQGLAVRILDLSNNSISKISRLAFRNFRSEELYLQNNLMKDAPSYALQELARHLFVLDLSGNPLERSEVELPEDLTYLHTLNLSNTGLTHLPYTLRYLYQLQTLDVSNNFIANLNESGTRLLRRLEWVDLQGNPWNCDCGILPLQEWLKHQLQLAQGASSSLAPPSGNVSALSCSRPDALAGRAVVSVSSEQLSSCSADGWGRGLPAALYVTCSLIVLGMVGLVVFMWRKRHEMGYGRFCVHKDTDMYSEPHSPIKVISNPAAGAAQLPCRPLDNHHPTPYTDHHGPIKNQAWESALVISNPHRTNDGAGPAEGPQANGKVPGAETIV